MNQRAELAVSYGKKNFRVVPLHGINQKGYCTCSRGVKCTNSGKHPILSRWEAKATTNEDKILTEFNNYPYANIGFATGNGIFALDIDKRHGGYESLKEHGELKETVSAKTGGGGSHHYYKIPEGIKIPNKVAILPGVDIRSDGGLVVAPGSIHISGAQYEWMPGCSPFEMEIAEPDGWLIDLIINENKTKGTANEIQESIEEGSRNVVMTSIAGTLRRRGLSFEAILAALSVENENRCNPPLEYQELQNIAKSISRYKPEDPITVDTWNEEGKKSLHNTILELDDYSKVYETEILSQLTLAKKNDPVTYAAIKAKLKGKVNLNDLERAIKHQDKAMKNNNTEFGQALELDGLELEGIELHNYVVPKGWQISQVNGITHHIYNGDGSEREVTVSFVPIIISRRFRNLDTGFEKVELSFNRDGKWKKVLSPRSVVFNRNSILRLADNGFPVTSNNAGDLIAYLADFEQANDTNIPVVNSVSRLGWIRSGEFFPISKNENLEFETDSKEASAIMTGLTASGDENKWLSVARVARKNSIARFLIAASFASVLLEPLRKRVFFIHLWHNSRSGKTATLKLAIAAWGNPHTLIGSFNSTIVGLERRAAALRNLPFAIDELQVLNTKKMTADSIIYMLSQGQGRTRGSRDGGLQDTLNWRNIILTTGEEAMLGSSMQDGANSRTLELYAKPVEDIVLASKMHEVSEQNYGHAGKVFIERLCGELSLKPSYLNEIYELIKGKLKEKHLESIHLDEVAVVCLGDFLSSMYVFGEDEATAMNDAIEAALFVLENNRQLTQADNIERAWEMFSGWLIANSTRFGIDAPTPQYGRLDEKGNYLVIPSYAHKALEDAGFSPKKVFRGFAERGYIESQVDSDGVKRFQLGRNIMGKTCRVYVVKVPEHNDETIEPLLFK
ncbi:DUF927 domain-containing protein [Ruminiclostridium herbifermentans]|uniref:DUF927 domain-containing protein n=1 Tax=Ruminiclostridium herbifermentans TaxID=2488810 RepID=A0A4U7J6S1_9FIRM|nr:DUF927 domain-containing protein [Ruminiclostridium herbifermentans]QNU66549.1 DUF927 domain-containing protein [Ruminiclostridium herbifermentans]